MSKKLSKEEEAQLRKEAIEGFGKALAAAREIAVEMFGAGPSLSTRFGVVDRILTDADGKDWQPSKGNLKRAQEVAREVGAILPGHVFEIYDRLFDENGRDVDGARENLTTCAALAVEHFGIAFGQTDEEAPALDIFDRLFGVEEED